MSTPVLAGSPAVAALARTLLHSSWQSLLIASALWLVLGSMSRARSSVRYAACCAALAAMPIASIGTFWRLLGSASPAIQTVAAASPGSGRAAFASEGFDFGHFSLALSAAWALGCAVMIVRLTWGVTQLRRVVERAGAGGLEPAWQERVAGLARQVGVHWHVRLLTSTEVDAPLLIGWVKPVILIPLGALTALPPAYVEALLVHELGHARRLDYLVNLLQACVEALFFYHPAVHWVSACLRTEREHCCDDVAVHMTGDRLGYARALEAMETWRGPAPQPALAANGGSLRVRIERIVRTQSTGSRGRPAALAAASVLAAVLMLITVGAWSCADTDGASLTPSPLADAPANEASPSISWLPPDVDRWKPALAEAARQNGVSPELLAIVVLVESWGDPAAHSPGGAIGLMQIMPSTAAKIAVERQLEGYSEERLWDPAYNLDFGAWYLAQQLAAFGVEGDRSVALAAVAYNGGPQVARVYLQNGSEASLYEETRHYRDLVVGMWRERALAQSNILAAWNLSRNARAVDVQPAP